MENFRKNKGMIYSLKGTVAEVGEVSIVVAVGGVGFGIFVPLPKAFSVGKEVFLHTILHWSQDHGPSLYGFTTKAEKLLFLLITSCSGMGPKIALAILRDLTPQEFVDAIHQEDSKTLSRVNGIGQKKAEQMIVYLKHKITPEAGLEEQISGSLSAWKDVGQALSALGYSSGEIQRARAFIQKQSFANEAFEGLLRHSLSFLSKKI